MTSVLISILNWNSSDQTVRCVKSLMRGLVNSEHQIKIRIVDNGSNVDEVSKLQHVTHGIPSVELILNPTNSGFSGGQNINIQYAMDHDYDYIWLLNNDTLVYQDTLSELIKYMETDTECGACSPVILRLGHPSHVDFCGAIHEWSNIDTIRPNDISEAEEFLAKNKKYIWAVGTALMIRITTIRQIGLLDSRYFAYYEDDDFGARLISKGWLTRIVLTSKLEHACFEGDMYQRPPYFFYLMTRNAIFFALSHVPPGFRKFLRMRYMTRTFFIVEKLCRLGHVAKADACMLGLADGLMGRPGAPALHRSAPLWIQCCRPLFRWWNACRH